jgi:hypothetical protein
LASVRTSNFYLLTSRLPPLPAISNSFRPPYQSCQFSASHFLECGRRLSAATVFFRAARPACPPRAGLGRWSWRLAKTIFVAVTFPRSGERTRLACRASPARTECALVFTSFRRLMPLRGLLPLLISDFQLSAFTHPASAPIMMPAYRLPLSGLAQRSTLAPRFVVP